MPKESSEVVSEMLKEWQEERRIHLPATKLTLAARYSHRAEDNEELSEMSSSDSAH